MSKKGKTSPSKAEVDALFERWMEDAPSAKALGQVNRVKSELEKSVLSQKAKSRWSDVHFREKVSNSMQGLDRRKPPPTSVNTRLKLSESLRKSLATDEARAQRREQVRASNVKRSATLKGMNLSALISKGMAQDSVREKMRKPRSEQTCPHCNHVGRGGIMKRWHFDNCKHKP